MTPETVTKRRFTILRNNKPVGTVEASCYNYAALAAGKRFLKMTGVPVRSSGWEGRPGNYRIADPEDTTKLSDPFYVQEAT